MTRRKGFFAAMAQASREAERQRQAQYRAQAQAIRAREVAQRAAERAHVSNEREDKRLHGLAREDEAAALDAELASRRDSLERILEATLGFDDHIDLDTLKERPVIPEFRPGALGHPASKPDHALYEVPPVSMTQRLLPGAKARHQHQVDERQDQFNKDVEAWEASDASRIKSLGVARKEYETEVAAVRTKTAAQHAEIDAIKAELEQSNTESVKNYFELVLSSSSWPDGFPQKFVLAYDRNSKLLGVDYVMPDWSIVPQAKSYRYVKAKDHIDTVEESGSRRRALYASVISQSALRILHEIFEADRSRHVETLALNLMVNTIDRATGTPQVPCILSVRATASVFNKIKLEAVDPVACLKGLSAAMSPSPAELAPVRPVLELKMVDPRFITETDVLSQLDTRPNLMELTPGEFEALITNLFTKMGLEARLTQASRDGGVDCVAFDPRPIFGGKVVIQAKRYKNTVGVSAVRDLYGTMQNEGASKGILVTTSGYGSASFTFAQGKPIELLSGANLLYLLAEHANIEARIVVPEQWRDPVPDEANVEPAISGPPPAQTQDHVFGSEDSST